MTEISRSSAIRASWSTCAADKNCASSTYIQDGLISISEIIWNMSAAGKIGVAVRVVDMAREHMSVERESRVGFITSTTIPFERIE